MRALRAEQSDVTVKQLEEYTYAERELFIDTERKCKLSLTRSKQVIGTEDTLSFDDIRDTVRTVAWLSAIEDHEQEPRHLHSKHKSDVEEWLHGGPKRFFARTVNSL